MIFPDKRTRFFCAFVIQRIIIFGQPGNTNPDRRYYIYFYQKECSTLKTQNGEESIRRGDIYYADLSPVVGSEQGGVRPVLIVQNDMGNKYSPTVIAAAITSRTGKTKLPTHIEVSAGTAITGSANCGLAKNSVILLEQIRTIDKRRLKERMGKLDEHTMQQVDSAIGISFGLN